MKRFSVISVIFAVVLLTTITLVSDQKKDEKKGSEAPFVQPELPYAYDALEPYIDAKTMEIHYTKHHAGYTANLNNAAKGTKYCKMPIEQVLNEMDMNNFPLRNNAGGYYNHNLFWEIMGPKKGGKPTGELAKAIDKSFGSFDKFKAEFSKAGATQFGSGWAWLNVEKDKKLSICATPNQDNPLMPGTNCKGKPILALDVWEHAYYLKYQNKRGDYIDAFFSVINWDKVSEKFQ
ncbi:MAG TPA: superoxide dismutase [bacterium]|nr:superoxide dismutase [bacterium]